MDPSAGWMQGTATQWLPVICQGTEGIGVEEIMPLVSYAVARGLGAVSHRTPQLTVPPSIRHPGSDISQRASGIGRRPWSPALLAAAVLLATAPLRAQRVAGPWEDGAIPARGVLRVGVSPNFTTWRERFAPDGRREPLGSGFTLDSLGPAHVPFLAPLSTPLAAATGLPAPPLSLGTLATRLEVTEVVTTVSLDYGLTARVGLMATIPYVKNHVYVSANPNGGGAGATLGFNPALSYAGARLQNAAVTGSLASAAATLTGELSRCAGSTEASCHAINADRAGAQSLVQLAGQVSGALAAVYGTTSLTGSLFAPVAGSTLQQAVVARLADLDARFEGFLGAATSGAWVAGTPVPAAPMAGADFAALLGDPAYGIAAQPFSDFEHSHVGDVEVGAKVVLVDTFGPQATAPAQRGGMFRLAVAGLYRLPTGQRDQPDHFADLGAGQGQADVEIRGYADVALGERFWTSAVARYAIQRPDRLVRRITDAPGHPFPESVRRQEVARDLGDIFEAEVAPRYVPNNEFSFSALFRIQRKAADAYRGTFDVTSADGTPLSLDASTLNTDTETTRRTAGFAVTFSTVRGHARGRARWPLEVSYAHTIVLSGKSVPRVQANAIGLRVYR